MSLLTRISVPPPDEPEAEDIFSSALTTIFTDDAIISWGSPGASILYRSPRYGTISLKVPIHPDEEQGRNLFAHYLWNAGVVAADAIESASHDDVPNLPGQPDDATEEGMEGRWDRRYWDVRGKRVLEIGAATALPSLIAALSGAASVTITDHPSSPALTAGAIEQNVSDNLYTPPSDPESTATPRTPSKVAVYGYTWGTPTFYDPSTYGMPAPPPDPESLPPATPLTAKGYPRPDKIIVADCLWMPSQHINIIRTILDFLPDTSSSTATPNENPSSSSPPTSDDPDSDSASPCALVIAGFHTGRAIVRDFFALAVGKADDSGDAQAILTNDNKDTAQATGGLALADIFETDMEGRRREWTWERERAGETKWDAKRWCVVGVLVRRRWPL